jgi:hypothetical protein
MLALTSRAIALLGVALAAGCATSQEHPPTVVLRAADGPIWIRTEEISRFRCETGLLQCEDAGGRLTLRRCHCSP